MIDITDGLLCMKHGIDKDGDLTFICNGDEYKSKIGFGTYFQVLGLWIHIRDEFDFKR